MATKGLVSIRSIARRLELDRRSVRGYAEQFGYDWQYAVTDDSQGQQAACLSKAAAESLVLDIKRFQERRGDELSAQVRGLKRELKASEAENARLALELDAIQAGARQASPKWMEVPESTHEHHCIVVLVLSDLHLGEVVHPKQVYNRNRFDVDIAEKRLKNIGDHAVLVARDYFAGGSKLKIDGAVIMLAGDLISGTIHQDLAETNAQTTMESIVYFTPIIAEQIIGKFLCEFKRLHIMSVPGNHDRVHRVVPAKNTATSAASWVISKWLQDRFRDVSEITWDISEAADTYHKIFSTTFCLTHGDSFRGGDGWAGPFSPIKRGQLRKSLRDVKLGQPFDVLVCGHFHSYLSAAQQGLIANGSLKGTDEWSLRMGFTPEPPIQALFTVTPEYGCTFSSPIFGDHHQHD